MTAAEPRAGHPLTAPVEDYLKTIHELSARGAGAATTNDIAQALAIAPASVSGMMRRLAEQGLIEHEPYRGARLTAAGRRAALRTIRRHRILECYLTRALGMPWDLVHEEAERLEHAASDELVERMATALGDPRTDPHGAPIPTRDGTIEERPLTPLAAVAAGARARVARVSDRDAERLRYLAELGVTPGTVVEVTARAPFDGPITLRIADHERVIGAPLAREVLVAEEGREREGGAGMASES